MLRIPFPLRAALAMLAPIAALLLPQAVSAQTRIANTASLTYSTNSGDRTLPSNTVELTTAKYHTKITFRRLPTDFVIDYSQLKCQPQPILYTPQWISAEELAKAAPLRSLNIDNPMIVVLEAPGENYDPTKIETTLLHADSGKRQGDAVMFETGPNTGIFAGVFPPSTLHSGDSTRSACDLTRDNNGFLTLSFSEDDDSYGSTASLLIDPLGHVFDSRTGKPINGATVTLIDDATGLPATQVFGDDGISAYPNQVISGQTLTDSSGWRYVMEDGDFRFPLLPPGNYRLVVTPPAGYTAPSIVAPAAMAALRDPHGDPFTIVAGSYGGVFTLSTPDPVRIDLPIDPERPAIQQVAAPRLTVEKIASVREAEIGDFIQYRLEIRNIGTDAATPLTVTDTLPRGLRYRQGSSRGAPEPAVSSDGKTIVFTLPNLAVGGQVQITYLVEVAPGAPPGDAVNNVIARAPSQAGPVSSAASAPVRIRRPLMTDAFTVIGRVTEGNCLDPERGRKGVAGIRLLMDDGSYVVTDKDGFYHFEGVAPGTRVVQLDRASVPRTHEPVT
ncbi:hypothetical protein P1X14_17895, partial [Sphingomonas sp. AOB5]|nr:hypothetical protein [Sphingomonas sp. AOB5]